VRYGIRNRRDPLIEDSLKVVDQVLKVDFPAGPCWRRYTHDGYGQRDDGAAYEGWGTGRPWPLLTGERGHYELAAGRDASPYLRAMEKFATPTCLLPEQIWDQADRPERLMYYGKPTGGAMPLMWAHAEYIKLLRSVADGQVFDLIPEVAARYRRTRKPRTLEIWKFNRRIRTVRPGTRLRVLAPEPFVLHWTANEWIQSHDTTSLSTAIDIHVVDIEVGPDSRAPICFTFFWPATSQWEGRDYAVQIAE
jgi:glucoamylase